MGYATTANGQRIAAPMQSRKSGGVSLRQMLINQGVTTEAGVQLHLSFIKKTLEAFPSLDMTRYRVNPNNPNALPMMG